MKLDAGNLILYPSCMLHSGFHGHAAASRHAIIFWVQSMIRITSSETSFPVSTRSSVPWRSACPVRPR